MYECFSCMYTCMPGAHGGQEEAEIPRELQMLMSHHTGPGNWTWVLCKRCKYSPLPRHLSSPTTWHQMVSFIPEDSPILQIATVFVLIYWETRLTARDWQAHLMLKWDLLCLYILLMGKSREWCAFSYLVGLRARRLFHGPYNIFACDKCMSVPSCPVLGARLFLSSQGLLVLSASVHTHKIGFEFPPCLTLPAL